MTTTSIRVTPAPDGGALYTTVDGDVLDHICWRHYGREYRTTEAVLAANRNLASLGPVLPAGTKIQLPVISQPKRAITQRIRLFD